VVGCLICGNSRTVESHLIPRALYREIAGDHQHGYEGNRFRAGVVYQAKGVFDRTILCSEHEGRLGAADNYGVDFIKRFDSEGRATIGDVMWQVKNPRPDLLVKFVAACIWRRGVSLVRKDNADLGLGAAEPRLRKLLFEDSGGFDPPLMVSRRRYISQGELLRELMFEPHKGYGWGDNTWLFMALGCEFTMKLNPYSSPAFFPISLANRADPVIAWNYEPEEISEANGIVEIAANMFRDPKTGKLRKRSAR
jgi:hypothetical protein